MIKSILFLSLIFLASATISTPKLNKLDQLKLSLQQKPQDTQDWANLGRYAASDAELSKLPAGSNQVVFMGDSITDRWNMSLWFPNKPYVNRGISGQTTPQMLVRFRPDLINLQPNVTIILAGTNDIANATGYEAPEIIQGNLASMAELARAHGIKVIMATLLPVCGSVVAARPPEKILELNAWIKSYCDRTGVIYLDYFSSMVGPDDLLIQDLTADCLHPNDYGYNVMKHLAQDAIDKALASTETH